MSWWCNHSEWGIPHHWECCESCWGKDGAHEAGADLPLLQWVRMYVSFPCLHVIQELDRWIVLSVVCLPSLLPQFSIPEFVRRNLGWKAWYGATVPISHYPLSSLRLWIVWVLNISQLRGTTWLQAGTKVPRELQTLRNNHWEFQFKYKPSASNCVISVGCSVARWF